MTFSIVAWDPRPASGPEWGIAVASKFLAAGAVVPWARAGAGALAVQAFANLAVAERGIRRLGEGADSEAVLRELVADDPQREQRQFGAVDSRGGAATFTGDECMHWAGGRTGDGYACQGNILAGPEVVDAMVDAFEGSAGDLADRLVASLSAGDAAGGDRRGREAAALLVVREGGGYGGGTDRAIDLRVDNHGDPAGELRRLLDLHRMYFPRPEDLDFVAIDDALAAEIREALRAGAPARGSGYDDELRTAFFEWIGMENLEERWSDEPKVDRVVLQRLRDRAAGRA